MIRTITIPINQKILARRILQRQAENVFAQSHGGCFDCCNCCDHPCCVGEPLLTVAATIVVGADTYELDLVKEGELEVWTGSITIFGELNETLVIEGSQLERTILGDTLVVNGSTDDFESITVYSYNCVTGVCTSVLGISGSYSTMAACLASGCED